jgi:hypothetical protein
MPKASEAAPNTYDCEAVCPEEISVDNITLMNRDYLKAIVRGE